MRRIHPGPLEIERQYNESQMSERSGKSPALTLSRVRMRKDQHNRGRRRIEPSRSIYESRQAVISGACSSPRDASSLCKMIWGWLSISGLPVDRWDARPPQVRRADHVLPGSGYLRVVRLEHHI